MSLTQQNPEFVLLIGSMFACKTTTMLLRLEDHFRQGKKIQIFKPHRDDRYTKDNKTIITHLGWQRESIAIISGNDILKYIEENDLPDVIAVDEAFMIPGVAKVLVWLFRRGMSVIVSSIELSYAGKPFKEITEMFPWATEVHKLSAVCAVCKKREAHYTYRKTDDDSDIVVGGAEVYEPRCWVCHPIINEKPGEYHE
jgi:thymidine kinase